MGSGKMALSLLLGIGGFSLPGVDLVLESVVGVFLVALFEGAVSSVRLFVVVLLTGSLCSASDCLEY